MDQVFPTYPVSCVAQVVAVGCGYGCGCGYDSYCDWEIIVVTALVVVVVVVVVIVVMVEQAKVIAVNVVVELVVDQYFVHHRLWQMQHIRYFLVLILND